MLGAPAICTRFSRLLIDPNRGLDDPTLIMRISDGAVVPGNRHLDAAERERRVRQYYEPYHLRIDSLIEQCVAAGVPPVLLSVHSFTDNWKGVPRPWHAAILWDRDYRFSVPLLEALRAEDGIVVGENEPYDGKLAGDCMWQHGTRRGLAHTILEVRQDLIRIAGRTARLGRAHRRRGAGGVRARRSSGSDASGAVLRLAYRHRGHAAVHEPGGKEPRMTDIDRETATQLEAAAFRRLVEHLRARTDVQNIDLMNLAGFCRNCLSNWYQEAAAERGHRSRQGRSARDRLRHALQGVAAALPDGSLAGSAGRIRQRRSGATSHKRLFRAECDARAAGTQTRILWMALPARLEAARRRR